jgi:hypothetical protein
MVEESKLFVAGRGLKPTVMLVIDGGLGSDGEGRGDDVAASTGRKSSQQVVPACQCEVLVSTFKDAPSKFIIPFLRSEYQSNEWSPVSQSSM